MRALSSLISDVRTFARLVGLLGLLTWGADTVRSPPADPLLRVVAYAQVAANLGYQPLENVAYLGSKGILPVSPASVGRLYLYSSRCWLTHVVLEFVRLGREHALARKAEKKDPAAERRRLVQTIVAAAYLPLCLNWSTPTGFLPDLATGALGTVAGGVRLLPVWQAA
ncbi:uncharacterized protein V1510DRAFT_410911 [Dipodascopsis tothii]|uniref:uncharacterized protein n=1 Tax=Dipodascopsis tothii TaxID=44089 RepID=UPI0034CD4E7E